MTEIIDLQKKTTDHKHENYITTPEFNKLTAKNFAAKLPQANLIKKNQILMLNCQVLIEKLIQINHSIYLFKINWKSYKHLIQSIFVAKVILKMMAHKIS